MKHASAVVVLAALTVGGFGFIHPYGDPRVEPAKGLDTLLAGAKMPAEAKKILVTKCADCHSNETRWPVYARVAPGSWLIERDIVEARRKMNLSIWEQMSAEAQEELSAKIAHEAKTGEMPPMQYRALHPGSKLTAEEVAILAKLGKSDLPESSAAAPGDAARGRLVFEKRCTGCHALDAEREGPRLAGVFGRKAGSVPGFSYSDGLKKSGITWDEASLERWLSDPDIVAPNTKMDFHVPKAQERSDLIAFFKAGAKP